MSEMRFGSYRVVEVLGSGALTTIYKAVQEPLGRVVILKALKTQIAPNSSFAEQLEREAKILRDLAHPNVVLLLELARTEAGRPFLVLENVEGASLEKLLAKKKALSPKVALAIASGICAALEHVHERGVIHRDLKPSNVLLTTSGLVKLIDFGIAQHSRTASVSDALGSEGITASGGLAKEIVKDVFGTPAYMSPEQILGDFVDVRSDLFSLGVVLYEMLSGARPFDGVAKDASGSWAGTSSSSATRGGATRGAGGGTSLRSNRPSRPPQASERSAAQRIRRDTPSPLRERAPNVPRAVEWLVMRLLEKSPDDRSPNASSVFERVRREFHALTELDHASVVRFALGEAGFIAGPRRAAGGASVSPGRGMSLRRALAGQVLVLVGFSIGVVAVEGTSDARSALEAGSRPLELLPAAGGGLRVLASPWAHVRVDGQDVETTPFAKPIPLSAGTHYVTLTHPDSPNVEREIQVAAGETITLDVTMPLGGAEDAGKDAQ